MAFNYRQWALSLLNTDKETKLNLLKKALEHCEKGIKLEKDNMRCYELAQECKECIDRIQNELF